MSDISKRRKNLWNQSPLCSYCNVVTILPSSLSPEELKRPPPNLATVEHVFHRLDPRRKFKNLKVQRRILACYSCNQKKGKEDNDKFLQKARDFVIRLSEDFDLNFCL